MIVQQRQISPRILVTEELDHHIQLEKQPVLRQRSGVSDVLMSIGLLAVIAVACAFVWFNYGGLFQASSSVAQPVADARGEERVALKDFQTFRSQTADSLQSMAQDIATQKAELNGLSDQVLALTAKIDALQSVASPGPPQKIVPSRQPVVAAKEKPKSPKPTGPLSVGGAPLPPTPPDDR
jgi:hypothetical protein